MLSLNIFFLETGCIFHPFYSIFQKSYLSAEEQLKISGNDKNTPFMTRLQHYLEHLMNTVTKNHIIIKLRI